MLEAPPIGYGALAKEVIILLLLLATLINGATAQVDTDKKECDLADTKYAQIIRVKKECYFVINGSTVRANPQDTQGRYQFNIAIAREICKIENATLPMVKSNPQNKFLVEHFKKVKGEYDGTIALGLQQDSTTTNYNYYTWDDGSNLTYQPEKWPTKNETARYTILLVSGAWENRISAPENEATGVVCRKPLPRPAEVEISPIPIYELGDGQTYCDLDKNATNSSIVAKYNNESCFFMLRIKKFQRHEEGKLRLINFDPTVDRNACKRRNATLPIVDSKNKNAFLTDLLRFAKRELVPDRPKIGMPIGLQRRASGYEWDDGTRLDYESVWKGKHVWLEYINTDIIEIDGTWTTTPIFTVVWALLILCEQRYQNQPATKAFSTAPPHLSKCNNGTKEVYPQSAVWNDTYCYFIVAGATKAANQFADLGGDNWTIHFDIWEARKICRREGATLPILNSVDEHAFVSSTFSEFDTKELRAPVNYIALDLRQPHKQSQYEWEDQTPLIWKPRSWYFRGGLGYAYFVVIQNATPENWLNFGSADVGQHSVGVLCKQRHERDPNAPTAQPSTQSSTSKLTQITSSSVPQEQKGNTKPPDSKGNNIFTFNTGLMIAAIQAIVKMITPMP